MNDLVVRYRECFESIEPREIVCYCPIHKGDTLRQVIAKSKTGKMLVVMTDKYGVHASLGRFRNVSEIESAPLVSESELEYMICEAIQ